MDEKMLGNLNLDFERRFIALTLLRSIFIIRFVYK